MKFYSDDVSDDFPGVHGDVRDFMVMVVAGIHMLHTLMMKSPDFIILNRHP